MKDFLQKNVTLLSAITGIAFVCIFVLLGMLIYARELQQRTLERVDEIVANVNDLPGPKNQISERSKKEIEVLFAGNSDIVGIYATKIHYEKTENPIFFWRTEEPIFLKMLANYDALQKSGKGNSSAELNLRSDQSLRNSEEAKSGLIKCDTIHSTNIPKLAPGIENYARGVCRATIPPFDERVNIGLVVLIKPNGQIPTPQIQEIRRILLQLQIDIYNRDFKGRETWAHD